MIPLQQKKNENDLEILQSVWTSIILDNVSADSQNFHELILSLKDNISLKFLDGALLYF